MDLIVKYGDLCHAHTRGRHLLLKSLPNETAVFILQPHCLLPLSKVDFKFPSNFEPNFASKFLRASKYTHNGFFFALRKGTPQGNGHAVTHCNNDNKLLLLTLWRSFEPLEVVDPPKKIQPFHDSTLLI